MHKRIAACLLSMGRHHVDQGANVETNPQMDLIGSKQNSTQCQIHGTETRGATPKSNHGEVIVPTIKERLRDGR